MPSASVVNSKVEKQNSVGSVQTGVTKENVIGISTNTEEPQQISHAENSTANVLAQPINTESNTSVESSLSTNKKEKEKSAGANKVSSNPVGSTTSNEGVNPMKQVLVTIEHKIRNLEKRKTKLESYRAIQATGKELSNDQKNAVSKYDSVMATLDFARDLSKQLFQYSKDAEKEQRKQARKDSLLKAQAETAKLREALIIQNILAGLADENVRNDFQQGINGAIKLEASELEILRKFNSDVQTRRPESAEDTDFITTAQKAAELLSFTIDGRPKQYGEITFENLRRLLTRIQECGYYDKIYFLTPTETKVVEEEKQEIIEKNAALVKEDNITDSSNAIQQTGISNHELMAGGESIDIGEEEVANIMKPHLTKIVPVIPIEPIQPQQMPIPVVAQQQSSNTAGLPNYQGVGPLSGSTTPVHVGMFPGPPQLQQPLPAVPPAGIINVNQLQAQIVGTPQLPQQQPQQQPPQTQNQVVTGNLAAGQQLAPQSQQVPVAPSQIQQVPGQYSNTVRPMEQGYFKQQQYIQQIRPLAEVIGGSSFFFLQDSELDSPEIGGGVNVFESKLPTELTVEVRKTHSQPATKQMTSTNIQTQQLAPIPTQTFTNQAFPNLNPQPQQAQPQTVVGAAAAAAGVPIGGGQGNRSNNATPSPMFPPLPPSPKQQQFSPVGSLTRLPSSPQQSGKNVQHQQSTVLIHEQQSQSMIQMGRINTPNQRSTTQQPQHVAKNVQPQQQPKQQPPVLSAMLQPHEDEYSYDITVTTTTFEKQIQKHPQGTKHQVSPGTDKSALRKNSNDSNNSQTFATNKPAVATNEWRSRSTTAEVVKGSAPRAGNITQSNKWNNSDMNAMGSTRGSGDATNMIVGNKPSHWPPAGNNDIVFGDRSDTITPPPLGTTNESNHWSTVAASNQETSPGFGRNGNATSGGGNSRNNSEYQQRRGERVGGGTSNGNSGGGGNNSYRGRSNNYANSSQNSNGSGGGRNNSGIYFRNNENPRNSGGGGSSSYYQNGGGGGTYNTGKDSGTRFDSGNSGSGGNTYRNQRNNANNSRNSNAQPQRSVGRNSGGGGGGGGNSGTTSNYLNSRQGSRLSMGSDNKH